MHTHTFTCIHTHTYREILIIDLEIQFNSIKQFVTLMKINYKFYEILNFFSPFSPFISYSFILKTVSQYAVLDDLKLTMNTRLTLNFLSRPLASTHRVVKLQACILSSK